MALYEVTTRSTFELKYLIEADSPDAASETIETFEDSLDPYQKFVGEEVTQVEAILVSKDEAISNLRKDGYE